DISRQRPPIDEGSAVASSHRCRCRNSIKSFGFRVSSFELGWDERSELETRNQTLETVSMPIITLLTDFGTRDYFVGAMKGVILSANPTAVIVDLTHELPPQDVRAAAFNL